MKIARWASRVAAPSPPRQLVRGRVLSELWDEADGGLRGAAAACEVGGGDVAGVGVGGFGDFGGSELLL